MTERALPTAPSERIVSLDVLRGIAILGILIMNIQSFSMIGSAYTNPMAYGDLTGLNKLVWILSHLFADQKFLTIFSILFGAGIVMMSGRATAKGLKQAGIHYRRTFWLLLIGAIHAYLFWYGDVLVIYALCSLFVFLFRNASPKKLLIGGLLMFSVASIVSLFFGFSMVTWPVEVQQQIGSGWKPNEEAIRAELAGYRGGWLDQMTYRVPAALALQTFLFLVLFLWRAGGLMLVGMALYKWGVLTAERSSKFYKKAMLIGFGIGFPMVGYGVFRNFAADWAVEYSMFLGGQFNYWGSLFIASGYIAATMYLCRKSAESRLMGLLGGVGRAALSNYLMQTIICTTLFYGHGFGLFGSVERKYQFLIVVGVWLTLVFATEWWFKHYRFGPLEWLWRSLTYWKRQPLRISTSGS